MLRLPNNVLQKALIKLLKEKINPLIGVHDFVPANARIPYITIGNIVTHDTSTKTEDNTALIESSVRMLMATGDCSIENIALCMGMHPKKLQRALKMQGTTYRDILENVRKKEALRMLDAGNVNLTDIALQLGYAELSIFSRNFKSWFGVPPTELRDKSRSHIV